MASKARPSSRRSRRTPRGVTSSRWRHAAPERQRHNVVLGWICARFAKAVDDGVLLGGAGFEQEFLAQACLLRAKMGTLPDERVDRMPLAYMHIVQVLVDMLCVLSPIALYPKVRLRSHSSDHTRPQSSHTPLPFTQVGELSIFLSAILALFYRGFLSLSKSFLDPFGNSGSKAQNINTDVFLAESNAGAPRWSQLGERVPA